jgi:hypothetical protein
MRTAYDLLLRLYPWDYRAAFGREMLATFNEAVADMRGRTWQLAFVEFSGLLMGVGREWFAKLTTNPIVRGRALPDVRLMRPVGIPREVWFRATESGAAKQCSSDTWL